MEPRGWPCHLPAERSSIGPAFSVKRGSRGKIPDLSRHGVMASAALFRHTVLRLSGVLNALRPRAVMSARDCRLRGCLVSAPRSQVTPLTSAWSRGEKNGRAPPSGGVRPRKSPQRPTACANVGPEPPKGPRVGPPPHAEPTAPGGAAGPAGTAGRTATEPSCVGPRPWLPVKSHRGRRGRTSVWAQTCGAPSIGTVQWFCCGRIIGHPLQPVHYF